MPPPLTISSPSTDQLPTLPSPTYSPLPSNAERRIRPSTASAVPHTVQGSPAAEDWIFSTSHLQVHLGPRDAWGLHKPVYGLGAIVLGHVGMKGAHVGNVTATLKGNATTTIVERGLMTAQQKLRLFSHSTTLYSSSSSSALPTETEISIPIPPTVELKGYTVELPPSLSVYHPGISCEVTYVLRIDMVRKGFRRNERLNIPIMYLPKSYPPTPPLYRIPLPTPASSIPNDPRVRSVKLAMQWPKGSARRNDSECSVFLTLPESPCFTSGDTIPFLLTLLSPTAPTLPGLLTTKVSAHIIKRTTLRHEKDTSMRDVLLGGAELWEIRRQGEGVKVLRGAVRAGKVGEERSWGLREMVDVEYILRILLKPPSNMSQHLPSVRHEETIQVATDLYGSQQRELLTMGGRPTPALGLVMLPALRVLGRSMSS